MELIQKVKIKLEESFNGAQIQLYDDSADHAGHGASGAHLRVEISYKGFADKSLIEQHRMVNEVLKEELKGEIHALQIKTGAI